MKKRVLIPLLLVCLLAALLPAAALADTASSVPYYSWDDSTKELKAQTCSAATVVSDSDTTWGDSENGGWYVVNSQVNILSRITVSGTVHLILADGSELIAENGIQVAEDNRLFIYGQENGTGELHSGSASDDDAAIGGNGATDSSPAQQGGTITIDGGTVIAQGQKGAGIGGGGGSSALNDGGDGGSITINGGAVTAFSVTGAGIGGGTGVSDGKGGSGGTITINGGEVTAYAQKGAGIGGGNGVGDGKGGDGGSITISGGYVMASGTDGSAGIGGGYHGDGGSVTISGGTVLATGIKGGAGIGGGYHGDGGNVTISGGDVAASGTLIGGNDSSISGAGIGGGYHGDGGSVTISGGTVSADSIHGAGIGGGGSSSGASGSFQTTSAGNAVISASSERVSHIQDQSGKENWCGVIFEDDTGKVYGSLVTPVEKFAILSGQMLYIGADKILNASKGVDNDDGGKIFVDGTFVGTANSLYYPLTLINATASNTSEYNGRTYGLVGSGIALTPDQIDGKQFDGWDVDQTGLTIIGDKFTMPCASVRITATYRCMDDGHRGGTATCTEKAVCSECGEAYGDVDSTNHVHLAHKPASDATVTQTGNIEYWYCPDCSSCFSDADGKNAIRLEDTVTPKRPPEIIDGMDQSISVGEKKALSFTSNAAFSDFKRVELDGKTLSSDNCTVREGSTIVTLKAAYVATLPAGAHTIGIVSESGTAETTFYVNPQLPQTGDNSRMALWMALLLVSGGLLAAACIRRRSAR
ncbi:MAG: sortase B protein-sorting domain-containing protein [Aristaeellaceae bacterium]